MGLLTKEILSKEELQTIAKAIYEVEKNTIGEIRVEVKKKREWKDRNHSIYDIALHRFYELAMDKTKDKTGVLVFLLFSEHQFQIIADEGINKKISKEFWDVMVMNMTEQFRGGKFVDGICYAVTEIGKILAKEFPMQSGDTNELSNDVVIS